MISFKCTALLLVTAISTACAGSEYLIKQRAKDVRDQNNERQGVDSSAPSGGGAQANPPAPLAYPAPRPAGPKLSPQASLIGESLEAVAGVGEVTDDSQRQLVESLSAAARATEKPSEAKLRKLGKDLAIALVDAKINASQRSRLATQLERALNDPLTATEMEALAAEVTNMLRDAGAGKVDSTIVSNDLKSIIAEIQRGTKN